MSELRSTIGALRFEVVAELPDARIEEDFAELHRAVEQLDVERLRRLAEIERRRLFERDGHLSAAAWLAHTFKVAWGPAREQLRIARGARGDAEDPPGPRGRGPVDVDRPGAFVGSRRRTGRVRASRSPARRG